MNYSLIGTNSDSIFNIFKNRGVNPNSILSLSEKDILDPFLMKNMDSAVETVYKFIKNDTRLIAIQQDPDADGLASTAQIYMYLTDCYPELRDRLRIYIQPGKAHGIQIEEIKKDIENGDEFCLVIAPDCSSNEGEVHKELHELGITTVVLDHHDAEKYSEYAVMVNPFLDSYPNKSLSGVGVCQKFSHAFDIKYGFNFSKEYFDLVAVGLVGDMIEINTPESIYMVQQGLKSPKTAFMKSFYKARSFQLGEQTTPMGIAFYITPLLNATTRVGTIEEKELLTRAMCEKEFLEVPSTKRGSKPGDTEVIQEQAIRIMNNIRARQNREVEKAMAVLEDQIKDGALDQNQIIILDSKGEFSSEFNGLIANKFLQRYKKPILVGKERVYDGVKVFSGSARGDDKSTLPNLKSFLNNSGKVIYAEGHESAHGFAIPSGTQKDLELYFNEELANEVFEPVYKLDFIQDFSEISVEALKEITRYATYWARGLEEPVFLLKNVPVFKGDIESKGDFENQLVKFKAGPLQFVKFSVPFEQVQQLTKNQKTTVDVIGKITMNNFRGESNLQIIAESLVVKESKKYYF